MSEHDLASPPTEYRPSLLGTIVGLVLLGVASVWAFTDDQDGRTTEAGVRVDPGSAYNPVSAGEPLPDGFRQLLPRDAIMPIYDPEFRSADQTTWSSRTDVIGVEIDGEARAYPVSFLNGRELVIDELSGIPILVSW